MGTIEDWHARKKKDGRCGLYRFQRIINCGCDFNSMCLNCWYQAQEVISLPFCVPRDSHPMVYVVIWIFSPFMMFGGSIVVIFALLLGILDILRALLWVVSCGCVHNPLACKCMVTREFVAKQDPIEPIIRHKFHTGERRSFFTFYGTPRPCGWRHCCSCYDDMVIDGPFLEALEAQDRKEEDVGDDGDNDGGSGGDDDADVAIPLPCIPGGV
eukprot:TRINITY_DN6068_c0_g1_i1.p1 TRINITY_DN6068_c0_g1~~TRINITY_DN6068_c0_g1_i1.p1  ORF type:complete len:213 (-),score=32.07 TRINITY_DN6068_c0_g1_i1:106-744(-)